MSLLSRLFGGGGGADKGPEPIDYEGYRIYPEPIKESDGYRLAARIERGEGDALQVHKVIRADTIRSFDEAVEASELKCKQIVDQLGERMFD